MWRTHSHSHYSSPKHSAEVMHGNPTEINAHMRTENNPSAIQPLYGLDLFSQKSVAKITFPGRKSEKTDK